MPQKCSTKSPNPPDMGNCMQEKELCCPTNGNDNILIDPSKPCEEGWSFDDKNCMCYKCIEDCCPADPPPGSQCIEIFDHKIKRNSNGYVQQTFRTSCPTMSYLAMPNGFIVGYCNNTIRWRFPATCIPDVPQTEFLTGISHEGWSDFTPYVGGNFFVCAAPCPD